MTDQVLENIENKRNDSYILIYFGSNPPEKKKKKQDVANPHQPRMILETYHLLGDSDSSHLTSEANIFLRPSELADSSQSSANRPGLATVMDAGLISP